MTGDIEIIRQSGATVQSLPSIRTSQAGQQVVNQGSELIQLAGAINQRVQENTMLSAQSQLTKDLSRIERENENNPAGLQGALEGYRKEFFKGMPSKLRPRLELQFENSTQPAITRAYRGHQQIVDEEARTQALFNVDQIKTDMAQTSVNMFHNDPVQAHAAAKKMQELMIRSQETLEQKNSKGVPLFGASTVASQTISMRDMAYEEAARGWVESQPNRLAAAQQWINGEVEIQMPDGEGGTLPIPLRETMTPEARKRADNVVMGVARDQMAFQSHAMRIQEKQDKQQAEAFFMEHSVRMQDQENPLTLQELDQAKEFYLRGDRGREYLALREIVLSGEPSIEDPVIKNQILTMAVAGIRPSELGMSALENKKIKMDTLLQAESLARQTSGPASNTLGFFTQQLQTSLVGLNAPANSEKGAILADANIRMVQEYQNLAQQHAEAGKPPPSINDFQPIFEQIRKHNNVVPDQYNRYTNAPSFMPKSSISKPLNDETMDEWLDMIADHFGEKYGTDFEALETDPDYMEAMRWHRSQGELLNSRQGGVSD